MMKYVSKLILVLFFLSNSVPILAQTNTKERAEKQPSTANIGNILVLGDSLSAAYGIPVESGWVKLLQNKLADRYTLINASISGETTDGGLRSLPSLLADFKPKIVIIELGANDALRGFPLSVIKRNLSELVKLAQQANSKVLLLGNHIPPNYGKAYALSFNALFSELANTYGTALTPFMLEHVATQPELMQPDGLHPKASAQAQILQNIWPALAPLLTQTHAPNAIN